MTTTTTTDGGMLTPEQFAALLGGEKKHINFVLHLIETGEIPSVCISDQPFIERQAIDLYLKQAEIGEIEGAIFLPWKVIQRFLPGIALWAKTVAREMPRVPSLFPLSIDDSEEAMGLSTAAFAKVQAMTNDETLNKNDRERLEDCLFSLERAHKRVSTHWRKRHEGTGD